MDRPTADIPYQFVDDPGVRVVMALAKIRDPFSAVGRLAQVWAWLELHADGGRVEHATPGDVDHVAGRRGFADAMRAAEWLDWDAAGLVVPAQSEEDGTPRRPMTPAERAKKSRAKKRLARHGAVTPGVTGRDASRDAGVTPAVTGRDEGRDGERDATVTAGGSGGAFSPESSSGSAPEESQTLEDSERKPGVRPRAERDADRDARRDKRDAAVTPEVPAAIDSPGFRAMWAMWLNHRREKKSPVTLTSARRQFRQLELMPGATPAKAAYCLERAILSNWSKAFPPDPGEWDDAADAPAARGKPAAGPRLSPQQSADDYLASQLRDVLGGPADDQQQGEAA